MTRELLLIRHAKSAWDSDAPSDFERPLNKRGRLAAAKMGRWLKSQGLIPDYVICSPAERAAQTAQRLVPELGLTLRSIRWDRRIYEASVANLLAVLGDCPNTAQRVLLVGHNPGLEHLLLYLSATVSRPEDGKLMPTAAVACLKLTDSWQHLEQHSARLQTLVRPKTLPDPG